MNWDDGFQETYTPTNRRAKSYTTSLPNGTLTLLVTGVGGTRATRAALNFTEIR